MGNQSYQEAYNAYQVPFKAEFSDGENDRWKSHLSMCRQILDVDGNILLYVTASCFLKFIPRVRYISNGPH